jgi:DNA-binding IclR family transcriptional regulator
MSAGRGTQVVQRVAALLRLLATHRRTGLRLVDIERGAHLERSTAHRLLQGLIAERLAVQESRSKRYFLGPSMYEIGIAAAPHPHLREICHSHLLNLARITGDTVLLVVRSGLDTVCLDRKAGRFHSKVFSFDIGRRRPLGIGASSAVLMSGLSDDEVSRICIANHGRLVTGFPRYTRAYLLERIAFVRKTGYALCHVLELPGIRGVSQVIHAPEGHAMAAVTVSAPHARLPEDRALELAEQLAAAVASIEAELSEDL